MSIRILTSSSQDDSTPALVLDNTADAQALDLRDVTRIDLHFPITLATITF